MQHMLNWSPGRTSTNAPLHVECKAHKHVSESNDTGIYYTVYSLQPKDYCNYLSNMECVLASNGENAPCKISFPSKLQSYSRIRGRHEFSQYRWEFIVLASGYGIEFLGSIVNVDETALEKNLKDPSIIQGVSLSLRRNPSLHACHNFLSLAM